ncbi:ATP-binding protein, partial [Bacillaceae bacterium SIJ1]|uniref:ATP-binding protein n=1 Tax=Litoribacterium kuwaitense TaxID=1398745 RepID=UPI0013EE1DCF
YEKGAMIITSNKSYLEWGKTFGDDVLATAILDRLLHHSVTFSIKGDSYRMEEKKKGRGYFLCLQLQKQQSEEF